MMISSVHQVGSGLANTASRRYKRLSGTPFRFIRNAVPFIKSAFAWVLALEDRDRSDRRVRADARRSIEALLKAAMSVFAASGVDAPVRDIADKAGVGVGTVYRHFPTRADLIVAVFRHHIDACADAAAALAAEYEPDEALRRWVERYLDFIRAKRGLAAALHSGDPAYDTLPAYFEKRLRPALESLLTSAASAGSIRTGVDANDLLWAIASLCVSTREQDPTLARRMIGLLLDGLRYGVKPTSRP